MDLEESFMDEEDKREVKQTNNSLVLLLLLLVLRWGLSLSVSIFFFFLFIWFQNNTCQVMPWPLCDTRVDFLGW